MRFVMRSKIHRATVTDADVDYVGSISIDSDLMKAAGIEEWEKVHVLDVTNGSRLETYAIEAPAGSGKFASMEPRPIWFIPGDLVILLTFEGIPSDEIQSYSPTIVHVNARNEVVDIGQALEAVEYVEC